MGRNLQWLASLGRVGKEQGLVAFKAHEFSCRVGETTLQSRVRARPSANVRINLVVAERLSGH